MILEEDLSGGRPLAGFEMTDYTELPRTFCRNGPIAKQTLELVHKRRHTIHLLHELMTEVAIRVVPVRDRAIRIND